MSASRQRSFEFPVWGGKRDGAGRKSGRARPAMPHRLRETLRPYQPVHVTLRMAEHVWNLRSERSFGVIHGSVRDVRHRDDFRVPEFSIQGNHLHLIVEAAGGRALATGMRALTIRLARRLNAMMGRRGAILEDRYHMHVLRTPAEVRNAVRYVRGNFASHAARRGERIAAGWVDPYGSAAGREPRLGQRSLWPLPVTREAETWLLRSAGGWRCALRVKGRVDARPLWPPFLQGRRPPLAGNRRPVIDDDRQRTGGSNTATACRVAASAPESGGRARGRSRS
jgi:REP element-mobilizing transposase RayT